MMIPAIGMLSYGGGSAKASKTVSLRLGTTVQPLSLAPFLMTIRGGMFDTRARRER